MIKTIIAFFLGSIMILGGLGHFLAPDSFIPFLPEAVPFRKELIFLTGGLEIILGIGAFSPTSRPVALRLILWLLIIYTPLHVVDVFRADPAIGDRTLAFIRLPIQGFLIWAALKASNQGRG